jgi:tetratricopeptide (TPR) repeat protein
MDQKNWVAAEEKWLKAAEAAPKSYLAPIAVYNAAVAAEEQGNVESAIAFYSRAAGFGDSFPAAARAQFSVGRLEESRNNKDSAVEAYRNLLAKWPNEPVWPNLAQNRLLVLSD